jgi:hypothetical protein
MLNFVLEDRVQYSTVHVPNVFCDGHLRIICCVGIVQIHCTVTIRYTETFWSPCICLPSLLAWLIISKLLQLKSIGCDGYGLQRCEAMYCSWTTLRATVCLELCDIRYLACYSFPPKSWILGTRLHGVSAANHQLSHQRHENLILHTIPYICWKQQLGFVCVRARACVYVCKTQSSLQPNYSCIKRERARADGKTWILYSFFCVIPRRLNFYIPAFQSTVSVPSS